MLFKAKKLRVKISQHYVACIRGEFVIIFLAMNSIALNVNLLILTL